MSTYGSNTYGSGAYGNASKAYGDGTYGSGTYGALVSGDANAPEEEPSGGGRRIGQPAFTSADYMHWVAHTLGRVAATGVFDA